MEAGIDDVGFGVLYGLYDYRYETVALLLHALELEKIFGVGPHTISVPRLKPAHGVKREAFKYRVSDNDFKKLVAVLRLAVPYTGIILSTRETAEMRHQLLAAGVSQVSAGSCTGVGGYSVVGRQSSVVGSDSGVVGSDSKDTGRDEEERNTVCPPCKKEVPQFQLEDERSPDEVLAGLCHAGYLPSYCTACYRQGRTGDRFMALAKSGKIQDVCQPNAILTFQEYLEDYATTTTREIGNKTIREHLEQIDNPAVRKETEKHLRQIRKGQRDIYF